jgi:hypothetical protein
MKLDKGNMQDTLHQVPIQVLLALVPPSAVGRGDGAGTPRTPLRGQRGP